MDGKGSTSAAPIIAFAYYVSGHGYGHATRVCAFASHILSFPHTAIHIVTTAPIHVFSDIISLGAQYRYAEVDPVVSQPVAYTVDRRKSVEVLRGFLSERSTKISEEVAWLRQAEIDCVLSDAVFLACAAANQACLPSILITNFTFDSIYSFLSCPTIEAPRSPPSQNADLRPPDSNTNNGILPDDEPIPVAELAPLVDQIVADYRCSDLLIRLPGHIPSPAFTNFPSLPSKDWADPSSPTEFLPSIRAFLFQPTPQLSHYPSTPFPDPNLRKTLPRQILQAPLIVRHPTDDIYTPTARTRLFETIGIPIEYHDSQTTRVLLVSFGGQKFKRPSGSPASATGSRAPSPKPTIYNPSLAEPTFPAPTPLMPHRNSVTIPPPSHLKEFMAHHRRFNTLPRIATPSHIYIPGAPGPASHPPDISRRSSLNRSKSRGSRQEESATTVTSNEESNVEEPRLLPEGWIAVVCGAGAGWTGEALPEGFYVAPSDIYMPDLIALGDVLLGKLGYGSVSEAVDSCTPFVYVPRPLFIEEFGLRLYLNTSGTGLEMSREKYESGDWASSIEKAWALGKERKIRKRDVDGDNGQRRKEGKEMAKDVIEWVRHWVEGMKYL